MLELLAGDQKNIVAVGDNDQAIYRFRGASFGSFKLFLERFAGWREGEDSTLFRVSLVENYRSTPNILRVATQVIAQNTVSADFPKKVLSANKEDGEKIRIVELETEEDEARWIASELQRLHAGGRKWRDFAVLYRQHAHRDELGGRAFAAENSVCHQQAFHSRSSARERRACLLTADCDAVR